MVGRRLTGMTGFTVGKTIVIKGRSSPGVGCVAIGTLSGIMVGGGIPSMAGNAVGKAVMTEYGTAPSSSGVAV